MKIIFAHNPGCCDDDDQGVAVVAKSNKPRYRGGMTSTKCHYLPKPMRPAEKPVSFFMSRKRF